MHFDCDIGHRTSNLTYDYDIKRSRIPRTTVQEGQLEVFAEHEVFWKTSLKQKETSRHQLHEGTAKTHGKRHGVRQYNNTRNIRRGVVKRHSIEKVLKQITPRVFMIGLRIVAIVSKPHTGQNTCY